MVTDLHAKNQVNIYKRLEKKSGKPIDRKKSIERNETQTRSVSHGD